jgi:hypothetical protein
MVANNARMTVHEIFFRKYASADSSGEGFSCTRPIMALIFFRRDGFTPVRRDRRVRMFHLPREGTAERHICL